MPVDHEGDLILVIGASGNQGSALSSLLVNKWKHLRLNVSSTASKDTLTERYPNANVTQYDITDPAACKKLLQGVTACFAIIPPMHPAESQIGYNIIDAALANVRSGGPFKHLVLSSVIFPILRKLMNHDKKRYVEEYLVESGLPYTILQPTHLMETTNLAGLIAQDAPVMPRFWNPETPFTLLSCRDLAEAAAKVFDHREKHLYATYQLVGTPTPINYIEIAKIISEEIGKAVRVERKTMEEGLAAFSMGLLKKPAEEVDFATRQAILRLFAYYNDKGLVGNSNVLEMLLGRQPLDYREWVRVSVKELRGAYIPSTA